MRGAYGRGAYFCNQCSREHTKENVQALYKVRAARLAGLLPDPSVCACADCGKPARDYEHRDYTKPLDVQPVCRSCNVKRGPAFDSVYRPETEAA
jgi:hypothetical protein